MVGSPVRVLVELFYVKLMHTQKEGLFTAAVDTELRLAQCFCMVCTILAV